MKTTITLTDDGQYIRITIPVQLGTRSGRKVILSPNGEPVNPDRNR